MSSPPDAQRGTLIALEPRIRAAFHPLYHEIARRRDLTAGAKLVYAVLCSYHQMFSDVFPGRERLADDTGLSAHQLVDATKSLVDAALLHVKRRGFGQTNVYTLLRWSTSPDIPRGISAIPDGISGDTPENGIPIEEDLTEEDEPVPLEEGPAATLWTATLETLRTEYRVSGPNLAMLRELEVSLDRGALIVRCSAEIAGQWRTMLPRAAGRPVKFVVS